MFTVVTSFSPEGFEQYGRACVESFRAFWPNSVELICYWEGERPSPDLQGFDLLSLEPCRSFLARHNGDPVIAGRAPHPRWPWGMKARNLGYNFRFDAYKFARKVFAVAHGVREVGLGRLFWLDADTVTRTNVPEELLERLLPDEAALCYLPRANYHSELGFVGYNLNRIDTHAFVTTYEQVYAEDMFINSPAWDDCSQFDMLVALVRPPVSEIAHSSRAQPFDNSILGNYMVHNKGNRKFGGRGWVEGDPE